MSHTQFRMMGGEENDKRLSEFVALSQKSDSVSLLSGEDEHLSGKLMRSSSSLIPFQTLMQTIASISPVCWAAKRLKSRASRTSS